jgi:hypothetical protein
VIVYDERTALWKQVMPWKQTIIPLQQTIKEFGQ